MKRAFNIALVATIGLTGCNSTQDDTICETFRPPAVAELANLPASQKLSNCLHRWGYALAKGKEPASVTAAAVVGACEEPLSGAISQVLAEDMATALRLFNGRLDVTKKTGQPAPNWEDFAPSEPDLIEKVQRRQAAGLALFRVVSARAGNCIAPEASFQLDQPPG